MRRTDAAEIPLWTPLSASAGQADGRTYLGNLDLESETSHQVAFTTDFHGPKWQVQATPFYNFVSDYIQGTPTTRLDPNGRPVLQFQNVGRADLYGVDGLARYAFDEHVALRGQVSYVRGINRDNNDNLYRIAPLRGLLGTVTGLIRAFGLLGATALSAQQRVITGGIAEALIARAFGLSIAIVALIPFNYFNNRLERARRQIEDSANHVELMLARKET